MKVEIAIVISLTSLIVAVLKFALDARKSNKSDVREDTTALTTVIVKLENIGNDINEIKNDLRDVKSDVKDHSMRIVKAEQQIKVLNNAVFGRKEDKRE